MKLVNYWWFTITILKGSYNAHIVTQTDGSIWERGKDLVDKKKNIYTPNTHFSSNL